VASGVAYALKGTIILFLLHSGVGPCCSNQRDYPRQSGKRCFTLAITAAV